MKHIKEYILESQLIDLDVEAVKNYLCQTSNSKDWNECVDKQKFGDCDKVCRKIAKKFPKMFDGMYDCSVDYSQIAIKKLKDNGDNGEMFGNHYILSRNGTLYDFAKGCNTIDGIYLLTQKDDMSDKYKVTLSKGEKEQIKDKIRRYIG